MAHQSDKPIKLHSGMRLRNGQLIGSIPTAHSQRLSNGEIISRIPDVTMSGEKVRQSKTPNPVMKVPPFKCGAVPLEFSEVIRRAKPPMRSSTGAESRGRPVTTKS